MIYNVIFYFHEIVEGQNTLPSLRTYYLKKEKDILEIKTSPFVGVVNITAYIFVIFSLK